MAVVTKSVDKSITSNETAKTTILNDRIEVHAVGEVALKPDLYKFIIQLHSAKNSVEAAKQSVQRRLEYIRHVLHNTHKLPQCAVQVERDMIRTDQCTHVHCDVHVECTGARVAENCRNSLVEKLDTSVKVLPITCSCTIKAKEKHRSQAFLKAVANAKAKAESVALSLGMVVRSTLSITEHYCDQVEGEGGRETSVAGENYPYAFEGCLPLSQRIQLGSICYTSSVSAAFSIQNRRKCRHKSCPRHSS